MPERLITPVTHRFKQATTLEEVQFALGGELNALGFNHFACCSYVDPLNPPLGAVMMTNFPEEWLSHYSLSGHADRDPVFTTCRSQNIPFSWTALEFRNRLAPDQLRVLNEAAEHGLVNGLTWPLHAPGAWPACCSLVFGEGLPDGDAAAKAYALAVAAHGAARDIIIRDHPELMMRMRRRELQVYDLVGRGKDDDTIGKILGISKDTAHFHVQRVMRKYQLSTRMQAMVRAIADGLFHARDLVD